MTQQEFFELFAAISAPVGLTKKWRLILDFKDADGQDKNTDVTVISPYRTTDESVVERIKQDIAKQGGKLSALAEVMDNGSIRSLYLAPGYLEEYLTEKGLPFPLDMKANFDKAGLHPVNYDELVKGWKTTTPPQKC